MKTHQVIVGNVGTVLDTHNPAEALRTFNQYIAISKSGSGRASGEPVTLMTNGEPFREYEPMIWTEIYAGIYHPTCDVCAHSDNGTFYILNDSHDNGTRCERCHNEIQIGARMYVNAWSRFAVKPSAGAYFYLATLAEAERMAEAQAVYHPTIERLRPDGTTEPIK